MFASCVACVSCKLTSFFSTFFFFLTLSLSTPHSETSTLRWRSGQSILVWRGNQIGRGLPASDSFLFAGGGELPLPPLLPMRGKPSHLCNQSARCLPGLPELERCTLLQPRLLVLFCQLKNWRIFVLHGLRDAGKAVRSIYSLAGGVGFSTVVGKTVRGERSIEFSILVLSGGTKRYC